MELPKVKNNLDKFESVAKPSEDVIVKVKGFAGLHFGRYIHGADSWQINHIHGTVEVLEWWDLPKEGTGNR